MVSPLHEFRRIFQHEEYSTKEKIDILNKLIHESTTAEEQRKHYAARAFLYYELRNWTGTLGDIQNVERYGPLNGSLSIIKQKAFIQHHLQIARESITDTINNDFIDNIPDHLNLLDSISENHIDQMLNNLETNAPKLTKRKRKE